MLKNSVVNNADDQERVGHVFFVERSKHLTILCQKVGTDLMQFDGCQYLITIDYFSSFFEVVKLETTDSTTVAEKLKMQFSRHGIPEIVESDNGPQYDSCEFNKFAEDWNFQHITSSPHNP